MIDLIVHNLFFIQYKLLKIADNEKNIAHNKLLTPITKPLF